MATVRCASPLFCLPILCSPTAALLPLPPPPQLDHPGEKPGIRTVLGNCELSKADNRPSYAFGQSDSDQLLVQLERSAEGPPTAGLVTQPFQTVAKDIRCMLARLGPTQSWTWIGSIHGLDWVGKMAHVQLLVQPRQLEAPQKG